jgi:serine/threonine-protein kinase
MDSQGAAKASASIYPGATISGRFRIERLLGRGAMGSVWLARHLALDVDVAVKFIDGAFRNEVGHRGRFVLEAQSAARIHSPHVVNVLDFGEDDGRLYIAMEFLSGEDLGALLDRSKRLSLDVTARIVAHACRGLSRAHALGIAHRDIKPENLFLCGDADDDGFVVKILDFGVAKSEQKEASLTRTTAGALIGSPAFMSPEQARGLAGIDGRSDLFSLAVVAYHCLTGVTPFRGDSLTELLFEVLGADPEPVSKLVPGLPRALDAWFERALQKEPSRRFASAKEMAQAFQLAIGRHASSGSDYASSNPLPISLQARTIVSDDPVLEVTSFVPPPPPTASRVVSASNQTASGGVGAALSQLGELTGVLGAALVGPGGTTLAHCSTTGLTAESFGEVVTRALSALESFENLETARPQSLALHFEGASVLLRWIEGHVLCVLGTERVNPTVLTVNLNAAASKLSTMASQGGGAAIAFRVTLSGRANAPVADLSASGARTPQDPVPDAVLSQLVQLYAKPLGAVGRLSMLQRLKSTKPTYGSFADFVRSLAPAIDDPAARQAFLGAALELLPQTSRVQPAAIASDPPRADSESAIPAGPSSPAASAPTQKPAPLQPPKLKRTIVYRGRKIPIDD